MPLYPGQRIPNNPTTWDEFERTQKINYYQWIPFILGIQCIMFYLPKLTWQIFCFSKGGTNLETIVKQSVSTSELLVSKRQVEYESIAKVIENLLVFYREPQDFEPRTMERKKFTKCSFFVKSNRLGKMLVFWYFVMKIMYITNAIGQLYIIQYILGFNSYLPTFGSHLFWYIISGTEFDAKNYFPRIVFCNTKGIYHAGTRNSYIAQCVLPVNMLNEKIYTFLWCWILVVLFITTISIILWISRLFRIQVREGYIKKFMKILNSYDDSKCVLVKKFVNNFLRHDGIFLLRMIANNAGDLMTAHLVHQLWEIYLTKYQSGNKKKDAALNDCYSINLKPRKINIIHRPHQKSSITLPQSNYL